MASLREQESSMQLYKKLFFSFLLISVSYNSRSQELYVSTEPASNMAAGSIGFRLNSRLYKMNHDSNFSSKRFEPEIMVGVGKKLMLHVAVSASDMFQGKIKFEGGSLYGKYRFYSVDDVHEHFRMAGYARVSVSNDPQVFEKLHKHYLPDGNGGFIVHDEIVFHQSNDIDLEGNSSGMGVGMVLTKLKNKLAVSGSAGYIKRFNNIGHKILAYQPVNAINYTASAGYLLFPREYTSYKQTNFNLYCEFLGSSFLDQKQYFLDVAPAFQFIINSIARIDMSYRTCLKGNVKRMSDSYFLLRLEYNLLNVF